MQHATGFAERHKSRHHHSNTSYDGGQNHRQPYHHPHTSMGAAGHWLHLLSVAAPLVIGEVIQDSEKKWKAMRMVSVGGAILSEGVWTMRLAHDKKKAEEAHAALDACREQHYR